MKQLGIALACGALLTGAGCGGGDETFTASGTMTLTSSSDIDVQDMKCFPSGGYADVQEGAAVVVTDASGKKVGVGSLGSGRHYGLQCIFKFKVTGIPANGGIFSVEVAHRGEIPFKQDDATKLALTLGG